eukprot:4905417-Pyramimonas_sp.AAC.1
MSGSTGKITKLTGLPVFPPVEVAFGHDSYLEAIEERRSNQRTPQSDPKLNAKVAIKSPTGQASARGATTLNPMRYLLHHRTIVTLLSSKIFDACSGICRCGVHLNVRLPGSNISIALLALGTRHRDSHLGLSVVYVHLTLRDFGMQEGEKSRGHLKVFDDGEGDQ